MFFGGKRAQVDGAALAHGNGNAIGAARGGRSRAFRIREDVRVGEGIFAKSAASFGELFVGLAGETDHDIGADADAGNAFFDVADKIQIFVERVVAMHVAENAFATALERHVQKRHKRVRGIAHAVENSVGNRFRFDASDAHARDSGNGGNGIDHGEQIVPAVRVSADIHAGERDFARAASGEIFCFGDEIVEVAGTRTPARKRNNAVAAHEIATVLHLEIDALRYGRTANRGNGKIRRRNFPDNDARRGKFFAVADVIEHGKFFAIADDEIHAGNRRKRRRARLRITTDNGAKRARIRFYETANNLPAFCLGELRHRAGIDDCEVGGFAPRHDVVAARFETIAQRFGLGLIEPAAQREKARAAAREKSRFGNGVHFFVFRRKSFF